MQIFLGILALISVLILSGGAIPFRGNKRETAIFVFGLVVLTVSIIGLYQLNN